MRKRTLTILSMIVIIVVGINSAKIITDGKLRVVICDVGQGDGILVITPKKKYILIDAGPDNTIEKCITKHKPFFDRSLDVIIISHFHADHINGFITLFKGYSIQTIIKNELNYPTPEKAVFKKRAEEETTDIQEVWQGDEINLEEDLSIHVLWPHKKTWNRANGNWEVYLADFNDSSTIILLKYKQAAILLTGDAGTAVLNEIAKQKQLQNLLKNTQVRIYKASHHGSRDAISQPLLDIFLPSIAAISQGAKNTFGHPHKETLESFNKTNIPFYTTEKSGEIEFSTNGHQLWVKTEKPQ